MSDTQALRDALRETTPEPAERVFVIKTPRHAEVLSFFQGLGLDFVQEQHGAGPVHHACERNGHVFEIYPASKNDKLLFL